MLLSSRCLPSAASRPQAPTCRIAVSRAPLVACKAAAVDTVTPEAAAAAPAAEAAQASKRTRRPRQPRSADDQPGPRVSLSKDPEQDRLTMGALLFSLRRPPTAISAQGVTILDAAGTEDMHRAVRMLAKASRIMSREQPDKSVEVVIAKRTGKPSGTVAAQPQEGSAGKVKGPADDNQLYRFTSLLVDAVTPNATPTQYKVSSKTTAQVLATAIMKAFEENPQADVVLQGVGARASTTMARAVNIARVRAREAVKSNVRAFITDVVVALPEGVVEEKKADEKEPFGRGTSFTLRLGPLIPRS